MSRVLIVDDDDAYRSVMREHLSRDYQIIETAFPEKALVMAMEQEPDVILLVIDARFFRFRAVSDAFLAKLYAKDSDIHRHRWR
jgi:response regulator RpfG family c-di-GMP phosphodiesterase